MPARTSLPPLSRSHPAAQKFDDGQRADLFRSDGDFALQIIGQDQIFSSRGGGKAFRKGRRLPCRYLGFRRIPVPDLDAAGNGRPLLHEKIRFMAIRFITDLLMDLS